MLVDLGAKGRARMRTGAHGRGRPRVLRPQCTARMAGANVARVMARGKRLY